MDSANSKENRVRIAQQILEDAMLVHNQLRMNNQEIVDAFMNANDDLTLAEGRMDDTTIDEDVRMETYGAARIVYMNARMAYMGVMHSAVVAVRTALNNLELANQENQP